MVCQWIHMSYPYTGESPLLWSYNVILIVLLVQIDHSNDESIIVSMIKKLQLVAFLISS